ncbi:MAG: YkvA family protein [Cyanobacteria bacterium P01_C01_bin.38]
MVDIMLEDEQFIAKKFPRNTRKTKLNGFTGWLYTFPNQSSNEEFEMFVYNDDNRYQVLVVSPENASKYSLKNINISGDGHIVYDSKNGFTSLKQAFEVSKCWAMFSTQEETDAFPSEQNFVTPQKLLSLDKKTLPDYDEENFWRKLSKNAFKAGKDVIYKALTLYYATQSEDVPAWAKAIIFSSLAYFILPLDFTPDMIPGVGYTDDFGVLAAALVAVEMYVTPEHEEAAKKKLKQWFGSSEA